MLFSPVRIRLKAAKRNNVTALLVVVALSSRGEVDWTVSRHCTAWSRHNINSPHSRSDFLAYV